LHLSKLYFLGGAGISAASTSVFFHQQATQQSNREEKDSTHNTTASKLVVHNSHLAMGATIITVHYYCGMSVRLSSYLWWNTIILRGYSSCVGLRGVRLLIRVGLLSEIGGLLLLLLRRPRGRWAEGNGREA